MAAKWDELQMGMIAQIERGHLNIEEQESLLRKGLKDELARATAHRTAPLGAARASRSYHKILEAAHRIVARGPHDAGAIDAANVEAELDDSWTADEIALLWKTLRLLITPMTVSRTMALDALNEIGGPLSDASIREARSHLLRGYAEAHRRAEFLDSEAVQASGRGVMALMDDEIFGKAWAAAQTEKKAQARPQRAYSAKAPSSSADQTDSIYAFPSDLKFSEIIDPVLQKLEGQRNWKKDNGQRKAVCERAAWICGDKPLR